jgi:hypothetical protein
VGSTPTVDTRLPEPLRAHSECIVDVAKPVYGSVVKLGEGAPLRPERFCGFDPRQSYMDTTEKLKQGDQVQIWDRLGGQNYDEWVDAKVIGLTRRDGSPGFRAAASVTSNGLPVEYDFSHRPIDVDGEAYGATRFNEAESL